MRELLQSMGSRELAEWMAYERLEPWGEARADYRMGITTAALINCQRPAADAPIAVPADFMPDFLRDDTPAAEPTPEELSAQLKAAFSSLKG